MEDASGASNQLSKILTAADPALDVSMLLLSEALQNQPDIASAGLANLDDLAEKVRDVSNGPPKIADLVDTLFVDQGFAGDVENYHCEENSLLDRVLERRLGMPITLSAVVAAVGERIGLNVGLVGLPGHVVVGVGSGPNHETPFDLFIDAFSGTEVDRLGLGQRLRSIFLRDIDITESMLAPMPTVAIISRVCNNLMRTWSTEPQKLDRLIDLRAKIPQTPIDLLATAEVAEGRGRFDTAAALREQVNPDDPEIDRLWGRLN